jgi:hypothetical protein
MPICKDIDSTVISIKRNIKAALHDSNCLSAHSWPLVSGCSEASVMIGTDQAHGLTVVQSLHACEALFPTESYSAENSVLADQYHVSQVSPFYHRPPQFSLHFITLNSIACFRKP